MYTRRFSPTRFHLLFILPSAGHNEVGGTQFCQAHWQAVKAALQSFNPADDLQCASSGLSCDSMSTRSQCPLRAKSLDAGAALGAGRATANLMMGDWSFVVPVYVT